MRTGKLQETIYLIINKRANGLFSVMLVTASTRLSTIPKFDAVTFKAPGIFKFTWSEAQIKENSKLLSELGYSVVLYNYTQLVNTTHFAYRIAHLPVGIFDPSAYDLSEVAAALPSHSTYVELFVEGIPLSVCKPSVEENICCDIYGWHDFLFSRLWDLYEFELFFLWCKLFPLDAVMSPYALINLFIELYASASAGSVRAYLWYKRLRQYYVSSKAHLQVAPNASFTRSLLFEPFYCADSYLPAIYQKLSSFDFSHKDWTLLLTNYDHRDTLFWVNAGFIKPDDFDFVLEALSAVKSMVALCVNDFDPMYRKLLPKLEQLPVSSIWLEKAKFGSNNVWLRNARFQETTCQRN